MKLKIFLIATMAAAVLTAFAENVFYSPGPFYKVSVRGDVDVVYRCNPDSTGMARYDNTGFTEEPFEISIRKGKLDIRRPSDAVGARPVIYIWSDFLMEATNEGKGAMSLDLTAAVPEFKASLVGNGSISVDNIKATDVSASVATGNGTISLSGKCTAANYNVVGAGTVQADNLEAREVDCKVAGTGTIGCWALESINVQGLGSSKIYYKGEPKIKKTGGAKLFPMVEELREEPDAEE